MKVSVIIPNLNGKTIMEKNLPSLMSAVNEKTNNIIEVIIVDDGSTDGSVAFLKKNYPEVKLIKHTKNRGFSAAVNTGVRSAIGDLVLLLNTDVVPEKDFLRYVIPHFDNLKVFAVTLHEKGYGWAKGSFEEGFVKLGMGDGGSVHPSFYVNGGSGVFKKSLWKQLGGMDEDLFSPFYWEDIDLCYRAIKRGYICLWEPKSNVTHNHESTIALMPAKYVARIRERNQLLFIWKNIQSPTLIKKHIAGIFKRLIKHPGYIRVVVVAIGKLGKTIKAKKKEIKECSVSDEAVFSKYS